MAEEIDVEELLRRGGKRVAAPSVGESFARGASQGVSLGFGDEMAGASSALGTAMGRSLRRLKDGRLTPDSIEEELDALGSSYRKGRDDIRLKNQVAERTNSGSYFGGELGGTVATGLATGPAGAGLRGAVALGATEGAAAGLGNSEADLTLGDAKEYARAFGDTLRGGAYGAAGAGLFHVGGAAVRKVGDVAERGLKRARGELLEEAGAARIAQEESARAADVAQRRGVAVDHEAALKLERQRAREVAREKVAAARAERAGQGGKQGKLLDPNVDPDTRVLDGYGRGARKLRKDNAREVHDARARLKEQDITPEERLELEDYLAGHGDAVDKPVAFRLRMIEESLRKRGYSDDVVRRAMSRFDEQGNAMSRNAAPRPPAGEQPLLPERTQIPEPADVVKQGRADEAVRQGGGGPTAFGDQFANAKTRVDPRMQPDPFHDAGTRVGLVRTSPEGGIVSEYVDGPMHNFEFRDPSSGEVFEVVVSQPAGQRGVINFENIYPKAMGGRQALRPEGHAQVKNTVGPGLIRRVYDELAHAFPDARKITAYRATGANAGRNVEMRLPEVTRPGAGPSDPTMAFGRPVDLPELREPTAPSARALRSEPAASEAEMLPDMEDITQPGTPPASEGVQRFDVLGPRPTPREGTSLERYGEPRRLVIDPAEVDELLAQRRAAAAQAQVGAGTPRQPTGERAAAPAPEPSMRAPEDTPPGAVDDPRRTVHPPSSWRQGEMPERTLADRPAAADRNPEIYQQPQATRATAVPDVRRPAQETPRVVRHYDGQTRLGQAPLDVRMEARPSAAEMAAGREKGAMLQLGLAGYEGARRAHNFVAAPIGALVGITKEALKNPAARARAISLFKLDRLAQVRPEVHARIGAALSRALEKGPDRYAATRHVFLLRDPEFRAADAEVDKELEGIDDETLASKLRAAGSSGGE